MLIVQRDGGVATLTLNRPGLGNALGPGLVESLIAESGQAIADPATHTLVLRGEGRHFCTGLDLSDLDTVSDGDLLLRLVRIELLLSMWWHAPARTVALAHGRAWGAGADLFVVCEQRVAAEDTTLRFPGAQFGIVLGTRRLAERIGTDAARRAVLEGAEFDARAALAAGLVSAIGDQPTLPALPAQPTQATHTTHTTQASHTTQPVDRVTAAAIRAATRAVHRDADLAALVRSAAVPGLRARIVAYRARQLALRAGGGAAVAPLVAAHEQPPGR